MQALAQITSRAVMYDLSVLSKLDWDFGTQGALRTLYLDPAATRAMTLTTDCEALQPLLSHFDSSIDTSVFNVLSGNNCANTRITRMSSTAEIDDELFCTHWANTVRT